MVPEHGFRTLTRLNSAHSSPGVGVRKRPLTSHPRTNPLPRQVSKTGVYDPVAPV